jgi:hypothetical protein
MKRWLQRLFRLQNNHIHNVEEPAISVDEVGVRRQHNDGVIEQVTWDELEEVVIKTTAAGPYFEDFLFILCGQNRSECVVPLGQARSTDLLERLQSLPGFDNEKFIQATASVEEAQFVCWRKDM